MAITEVVTLGEDAPELLTAAAARYVGLQYVGLLDFALANTEIRYDGRYRRDPTTSLSHSCRSDDMDVTATWFL